VNLNTISFALVVGKANKISTPRVYNGGIISLGQKWWSTVLEIEISCSQWEGSARTQSALIFFFWVLGWGEGRFFFFFPLFPTCSLQVPNGFLSGSNKFLRFPMCSPRVFPIAPRFNPKVLPFSAIWVGQRGRHSIFHRIFIFVMGQSNWLIQLPIQAFFFHP